MNKGLWEGNLWNKLTENKVIYDMWESSTEMAEILDVDDIGWHEFAKISENARVILMDRSLDLASLLVKEGYLLPTEHDEYSNSYTYVKTDKVDDYVLCILADVFTAERGLVTEHEFDYTTIHKELYKTYIKARQFVKR